MKPIRKASPVLFQMLCMASLLGSAEAATFVVTNTLDAGPGSFREALTDAGLSPGVDVISLSNVTGQITLLSAPPTLGDTVIAGPGARQLTLATHRVVIDSAQITTLSGLRIISASGNYGYRVSGGIITNGGTLFLRDCEVTGAYQYVAQGTAIYSAGNLTITGSTLMDNRNEASGVIYPWQSCAAGAGGALYVASGTALITNSTFSGNSASSFLDCYGQGGAVYVLSGNVVFVNCTLASNGAAEGGAIYNSRGSVTLRNTIVTDSIVGTNGIADNNLLTNAAAAGLGPLQDNGGPTLTQALLPNCVAINRGTGVGAPITDQRGVVRPQGSGWDIGAFEFEKGTNFFQFDLAVSGAGSVSRTPDLPFYPSNEVIVLTALATEDYELATWSGDATGQDNPLLVRIDRDKSIVATFRYAPATVTNAPGATNYVVNTNGWGTGSFRQAIRNVNVSGDGVIRFSNVTGTISLPIGLPVVLGHVRIYGPGPSNLALSIPYGAGGLDFAVGVTGVLSGMTLRSAQLPTRWGGAISNAGTLSLRRVHFLSCGASNGGAIFNSGTLQASECLFAQNTAEAGGAIYNQGNLGVAGSSFRANRSRTRLLGYAAGGGAVCNATGAALFSQCVFSANIAEGGTGSNSGLSGIHSASGLGGALFVLGGNAGLLDTLVESNLTVGGPGGGYELNHYSGSGGSALGSGICLYEGSLRLTNCALVNNSGVAGDSPSASRYPGQGGSGSGGAIHIDAGDLYAVNCTLSGNEVRGGITSGGGYFMMPGGGSDGIRAGMTIAGGTGILANCSITGNRAFGGHFAGNYFPTNFGHGVGGGINLTAYGTTGTVTLVSTIITGNTGATQGSNGIIADDLIGPGSSLGHNLLGTVSGAWDFQPSDLLGVDPRLGPLQDNGGPTPTHALLAGSPAIDAGAPTLVPFDQRGQPRTVDNPAIPNGAGGDGADIGALEVNHNLRLTEISTAETNVQLRFTTVSDKTYLLQYKSNATASTWVTLPDTIGGTGGIVTATNSGGGVSPSRFYRVLRP